MSLLMEALRKAEEAKSKAANKEDQDSEDSPALSAESSHAESSETAENVSDDSLSLETEQLIPELEPVLEPDEAEVQENSTPEQGPVVINPDPDEEETLASHFAEAELDMVQPDAPSSQREQKQEAADEQEDFLEQIEFSSDAVKDDKKTTEPESSATDPSLDDDDGLSLLQSSYFTRTQNPGGPNFADFELEDEDIDVALPEEEATSTSTETALNQTSANDQSDTDPVEEVQSLDQEAERGAPVDPLDDDSLLEDLIQNELLDEQETASNSATRETSEQQRQKSEKELEKQNRNSASSLFLAKQASQKKKSSKLRSIAAVLLIIPVAGIGYWFYSSFYSTPQMQFTVPANTGSENREFFGNASTAEDTAASETLAGAQNEELALDNPAGNEVALVDTSALAESAAPDMETEFVATTSASIEDSSTTEQSEADLAVVSETAIAASSNSASSATSASATPEPEAIEQATQQFVSLDNQQQSSPQVQPETSGLNFVRTDVQVTINPDLNDAYASYQDGDFAAAGRLYQQVLNSEPNNRDAMLGLASVYLNQGNISLSQNLYARLLELNPRDPLAMAGLLELSRNDDPVRQESELKSLINAYPGIAPLSYALGNLYASQNRWTEAQNAYFDALLSAKSANNGAVSPDYAFNLAVSLERVNQLPAALDYYREAEAFSRFAAPGFNPALLNQRLEYLEQRVP